MLAGVAAAARAARLGPVFLVTSEPTATVLGARFAVGVISDGDLPWNEGLVHAVDSMIPAPSAVLYLSGDLPLVTAADIRAFVDIAPPRGVAIARAHDGGTNALLLRPPKAIHPLFGQQPSAARHAASAAADGFDSRVADIDGLALDVDTISDLRIAQAGWAARRLIRQRVSG